MEKVVIVDRQDKVLGEEERRKAHKVKGVLHRGFIVLVFNKKRELLLLKRSKKKRLWPLFWDSCCSHPRLEESYIEAGERRLRKEAGFSCQLKYQGKFYYRAVYENIGSEEEICAVMLGKYDGKLKPNPEEVAEYRWVSLQDLKKEIKEEPEIFTPWLKLAIKKLANKDNETN